MIAELCAVVRLELARAASPRNLVVACLCAALALGQGYLTLGAHAALTGSLGEGATAQDVALLRQHTAPQVKVKAAGGIATKEDAEAFLALGADRLGTSRLVKLAKEAGL